MARFESDLKRLAKVFQFASLDEVLSGDRDPRCERPLMCVTFDDGFNLHGTRMVELLEEHQISATTFVITSSVGNRRLMWRHMLSAILTLRSHDLIRREYNEMARTYEWPVIASARDLLPASFLWKMKEKDDLAKQLWERCEMPSPDDYLAEHVPYFSWDGLKRWCAAGHSVGLHTHTHPDCSRLESSDLAAEFLEPAEALKAQLGLQAVPFSYPFGRRLRPDLEKEVFASGHFNALFGIAGFRRRGFARLHLERAEIEGADLSWTVFASLASKSFRA